MGSFGIKMFRGVFLILCIIQWRKTEFHKQEKDGRLHIHLHLNTKDVSEVNQASGYSQDYQTEIKKEKTNAADTKIQESDQQWPDDLVFYCHDTAVGYSCEKEAPGKCHLLWAKANCG